MMWNYSGGSWVWMAPMMILIWGGLIAVVVLAVRAFSRSKGNEVAGMDTLRRRLAAGEINQEEFENTKQALQG